MKTRFFLSLPFLFCAGVAEAQPAKMEIPIGVIAPLTLGNADRGQEIVHTLQLLGERLSAASSKYSYRFIVEDGKCGVGSAATSAAEKLIRVDKVHYLITGCSGETLQAGPIAQRAGVLDMAVFSAHQDVKKLGDYVFRTCPDQERAAELFQKELVCSGENRIGMLSEENAFTQGMKTLLLSRIADRVVKNEDYPVETTDFRTILLKWKALDLQALFFNAASPPVLAALVKQARELGITLPIYAYLHPDDPSFFQLSGKAGVGVKYLGVPDAESVSKEFADFMKEFEKRFGEVHIQALVRMAHDGLQSIAAGIEAKGDSPAEVKEFLNTYKASGATGQIAFDANGDLVNLNYVLKQLPESGKGVVQSNCKTSGAN